MDPMISYLSLKILMSVQLVDITVIPMLFAWMMKEALPALVILDFLEMEH